MSGIKAKRVKLARDDPRRLWPTMDRKNLYICPVCQSEFFMPVADDWRYKIGIRQAIIPVCRYNCMRALQKEREEKERERLAQKRPDHHGMVNKKAVVQLDDSMDIIRWFDSIMDAAEKLNVDSQTVSRMCKRKGIMGRSIKLRLMFAIDWEAMENGRQDTD